VSQITANANCLGKNRCVKGNNDLLGTSIAKNLFDEVAVGKLKQFAGGRIGRIMP
jgi:hypothetical protein